MVKNQTYKAFVASPSRVLDLNGVLLDSALVLGKLTSEIQGISAYATYVVRNDTTLGTDLDQVTATQPAVAGRRAGVTMPDFLAAGRTGKSRKEWLFRHRVVTSFRSWQERINAANGTSSKYVSQGWKRTVSASAPSYGEDYINLGAVDCKYAVIENNPIVDGEIVLKMVIWGQWYRLIFDFDNTRFPEGKVTLPLVKVENNQPVFIFTVATNNPVVQFSGDYVIGVDAGINNYATVVVRSTKTGQIVHKTTLSQRAHSLWNSVKASERQVRALWKKAEHLLYQRQPRMSALDEAQLHREASSRKKRELAIIAAQEIADLSHQWGNAVVAVEDLSWVTNTMQNGRWNRGQLTKWLTHYVSQNGGWVVSVNPANTSQVCHACSTRVVHPTHKVSVCPVHGVMDRDVNAAANIAARAVPRVEKARKTRAKNRKLQKTQPPRKTPPARNTLQYPNRDRSKGHPTPKRKNRISKEVNLPSCPARVQATRLVTTVLADRGAHGTPETRKAAHKQGNTAYKRKLCSLNRYGEPTQKISALNPQRIMVAGDWHGNETYALEALKHAHEAGAEVIIHVGDFGAWRDIRCKYDRAVGMTVPYLIGDHALRPSWGDYMGDTPIRGNHRPAHKHHMSMLSLNSFLEETGMDLVIIPGNHEDYDALYSFPVEEDDANTQEFHQAAGEAVGSMPYRWGLRRLRNRIWVIPAGYTWVWGGKTFMGFGGAVSVDKHHPIRVPHITWFQQETPSTLEHDWATRASNPVDVLVTHDCPDKGIILPPNPGFPEDVISESDAFRRKLDDIVTATSPKTVFYGHHHENVQDRIVDGVRYYGLGGDRQGVQSNLLPLNLDDL